MKYRPFGKTGLQVSALAMGCMRLPENDPDLAGQVVDAAIAAGVNYFETARVYINGKCQHLTALGLKGRSRGLIVSGKAGVDADTTADSYRKEIDLQMQILGVDYLEFFQIGWLNIDKMEYVTKKNGAMEAIDKARSEGLIGHVGFTGHDAPENFTKIIETGLFDSLTIPYNMLNRSYASTIKRAGELGVGVVAMCPVAGGMLSEPAPKLQALIPGGATTTADAALRFVLANPDISCACSGMNTLEMVSQNVGTVEGFEGMTSEDLARAEKILDEFTTLGKQFCTACGYCVPCPQEVDIPRNFRVYNLGRVYGLTEWAKGRYAEMDPKKRADACIRCGQCEPKCPNKLPIMDQLAEANAALG